MAPGEDESARARFGNAKNYGGENERRAALGDISNATAGANAAFSRANKETVTATRTFWLA